MATIWIAANEEQCHTFLPSGSGLEENSFSMVALSTSDSFSARESWICSNILQNLSAFPYSMMNLIPIDAVIVSNFLVITVATRIEKNLLISILLRIENVVTFPAKLHGTHLAEGRKTENPELNKDKSKFLLGF